MSQSSALRCSVLLLDILLLQHPAELTWYRYSGVLAKLLAADQMASRATGPMDFKASAYAAPHARPRYRASIVFASMAGSGLAGSHCSLLTKAINRPSQSRARSHSAVTSMYVSGSNPMVWPGPLSYQ